MQEAPDNPAQEKDLSQNVTTHDKKVDSIAQALFDEEAFEKAYEILPLSWVEKMFKSSKEFFIFLQDNQVLIANGIIEITRGSVSVGTISSFKESWVTFKLPRYREFGIDDQPYASAKHNIVNNATPNDEYSVPLSQIIGVMQKECAHIGWLHHEDCGDCGVPIDDIIRIAQAAMPTSKRFVDEKAKRKKAHMATTSTFDFDKNKFTHEDNNVPSDTGLYTIEDVQHGDHVSVVSDGVAGHKIVQVVGYNYQAGTIQVADNDGVWPDPINFEDSVLGLTKRDPLDGCVASSEPPEAPEPQPLIISDVEPGDTVCILDGCNDLLDAKVVIIDVEDNIVKVEIPKEFENTYGKNILWFGFEKVTLHKKPAPEGIVHDNGDPYSITIDDIEVGDDVHVPTPNSRLLVHRQKVYDIKEVLQVNTHNKTFQVEPDNGNSVWYNPSEVYKLDKKADKNA